MLLWIRNKKGIDIDASCRKYALMWQYQWHKVFTRMFWLLSHSSCGIVSCNDLQRILDISRGQEHKSADLSLKLWNIHDGTRYKYKICVKFKIGISYKILTNLVLIAFSPTFASLPTVWLSWYIHTAATIISTRIAQKNLHWWRWLRRKSYLPAIHLFLGLLWVGVMSW